MIRNADCDELKSPIDCHAIAKAHKKCSIPKCNNSLTYFKGPGSDKLCREHQVKDNAYGGPGYIDRPITYNKSETCDECGYNPWEDNRLLLIENEVDGIRTRWSMLDADHIQPKAQGGDDSAQNCATLCKNCHTVKTRINGDHSHNSAKRG